MAKPNDLKLVYVLKIGYNSKKEGLYEFIFAKNIDIFFEDDVYEELMWDQAPASSNENALVPDEEIIDETYALTTKEFDLWCLGSEYDGCYMDGVNTIHCLAHEQEKTDDIDFTEDYEDLFGGEDTDEDLPLLVFHFGMSLKEVEDKLYERDIRLKNGEFISPVSQ